MTAPPLLTPVELSTTKHALQDFILQHLEMVNVLARPLAEAAYDQALVASQAAEKIGLGPLVTQGFESFWQARERRNQVDV